MLGGVQCRIRRVDEVTRGVTNRDDYEKISRDIRYSFYKTCMQQVVDGYSGDTDAETMEKAQHIPIAPLLSGVIFGHHQGDVQENVISNVMR